MKVNTKTIKDMAHTQLLDYFQELIADIENGMDNDLAHLNFVRSEILARMIRD